jgi:hypothetical protein
VAAYTYRSARSKGLVFGLGLVIAVETLAFHLLLMNDHHPIGAWLMTLGSLSVLAWLVADYRAMSTGAVQTTAEAIDIRIGGRASVTIPREAVTAAIRPTFRDLPQLNAALTGQYVNVTKHVSPNVLLTLRDPVRVSIAGIIKQPARQIALHLDDPDAFIADLRA